MIKAIIVDDELSAGEVIQTLVTAFTDEIKICSICLNIRDAVQDIYKYMPDVLFLDVELADGSGFEILEKFSDLHARVVFVTAYEHYALKAIKYSAFDYILKPIIPDEMNQVLNKVLAEIKKSAPFPDSQALLQYLKGSQSKKIAVPNRNGFQYFSIDDIILIEGDGSYTKMHLADDKCILVSKIIKDFEAALANKGFLRVHKSFLVNTAHITELRREDSGYLVMSNGKKISISPRDKEDIIYKLKAYSNII